MGNIEDFRKVIQDLVAPDLKAISARLDGLEHSMNLRFDAVIALVNSNHATILNALDLERRMERVEARLAEPSQH